jgi:hypothetical protein
MINTPNKPIAKKATFPVLKVQRECVQLKSVEQCKSELHKEFEALTQYLELLEL